jgi:hypothetical protein
MSWLDRAIENTQEILEREAVEKLVLLMTAAAPYPELIRPSLRSFC